MQTIVHTTIIADMFYMKQEKLGPSTLALGFGLSGAAGIAQSLSMFNAAHNPIGLYVIQIPACAAQADIHVGRMRICR